MKILLADDNITAQKLGTKILTDAGYEVISVSNGAAAMKKIAAEKPQLLILDVFMPGYNGLEVCEKVKNAPDTARVPVLLTVTNMEPFNPGEGNRVRADGVMIKPFEASDLIAVVQKLEKKLGITSSRSKGSSDPERAPEVKLSPPLNAQFQDASYEEWKAPKPPAPPQEEEEEEPQVTPKKVTHKPITMSQEIASGPVFGTDEIATPEPHKPEPGSSETVRPPEPQEFAVHEEPGQQPQSTTSGFVLEEAVPGTTAIGAAESASVPAVDPVVEFNSEPKVGEIEVARAPELEVTAQDSPAEVPLAPDPALVVNTSAEITEFATKFGVEHPEEMPVGIVTPENAVAFVPDLPVASTDTPTVKMDALREAEPEPEAKPVMLAPEPAPSLQAEAPITRDTTPEPQPELQQVGNNSGSYSFELEMRRAFAAGMNSAAAAPAREESPVEPEPSLQEPVTEVVAESEAQPVAGESVPDEVRDKLAAAFVAEIEEADAERAATPEGQLEVAADESSAAAMTANDNASESAEDDRISQAVERVLDRYRPELIAAIVRELKG